MSYQQLICPCGSGKYYASCCGAYHAGASAPTPEALMRSRFSAFVLHKAEYLMASWHPGQRPSSLSFDDQVTWKSLRVQDSYAEGDNGSVTFTAVFTEAGRWRSLQEKSRFVREQGAWFYLDGEAEWLDLQPGRNDPCPCDSGKKFKKCCG